MAPQKLENLFVNSSLVQQVFVYGDSLQNYLVAVVVPDEIEVNRWTQAKGKKKSFKEAIATKEFQEDLLRDI